MLSKEENEHLTRVGPGTPCGELLRRYWHPVAVARELTEERPTKFVRVLGEDLVLFKDKAARVGLLVDRCSHRGASLLYGRVEERGIACAYHGWLYDVEGNCLECPAEPQGSKFHLTVKHKAYQVQKLAGLYWAYLGPQPAPIIAPYDILVRKDGRRRVNVHPLLDCNWFQTMENAVDPTHAPVLHQDSAGRTARPVNTTRGFIDDQKGFEFWEVPYGIMKRRNFRNGESDEHPLIFPNILRSGSAQIRVPVDDTHTWRVDVGFRPNPDGREDPSAEEPVVAYQDPYKDPPDRLHPFTRWKTDTVAQQDHMAWETQGPICDRSVEHLSHSDRAIVLLRRLVQENIEKVQQGLDPLGVIRDPNHPIIDTNVAHDLNQTGGQTGRGRPYGITTGTLMDQPLKGTKVESDR